MISDKQLSTDDMRVEDWPEPDPHEVLRGAVADALAGTKWACQAGDLRSRQG